MKNVLIISATLNTNYSLAKDIERLLLNSNVKVTTVSLEDYPLPLYTAKNSKIVNSTFEEIVNPHDKIKINNDCYPIDTVFGLNIYEGIHLRSQQRIYTTINELYK